MQSLFPAPILVLLFLIPTPKGNADWSGFRGGQKEGVSDESNLPVSWSSSENLTWTVPIPGYATSSPIVKGEQTFATTQTDDDALHVLAFHTGDGQKQWAIQIDSGRIHCHQLHKIGG